MQALKVGSEPFGQGIWSSVTDSDLTGSTWALNKFEASLLEGAHLEEGQNRTQDSPHYHFYSMG